MKINERNLCNFACTTPVDLDGWLNKRGEVNKNFQRRWFVLKGNLLFYFEKKNDKEPLGMIILEGCTIELSEDAEPYCFQIQFHGPQNRTYVLSADNQTTMETWMKALTCAGYDYMKLMVAELQRQLDELEGQKGTPTPENTPAPKAPPRRTNPFNKPSTSSIASSSNNSAVNGNNSNSLMDSNGSVNGASSVVLRSTVVPAPTAKPIKPAPPPPSAIVQQQLQQQTLLNLDDNDNEFQLKSDFSFQYLHDLIGKPIRDEINNRRAAKMRAEEPLISF